MIGSRRSLAGLPCPEQGLDLGGGVLGFRIFVVQVFGIEAVRWRGHSKTLADKGVVSREFTRVGILCPGEVSREGLVDGVPRNRWFRSSHQSSQFQTFYRRVKLFSLSMSTLKRSKLLHAQNKTEMGTAQKGSTVLPFMPSINPASIPLRLLSRSRIPTWPGGHPSSGQTQQLCPAVLERKFSTLLNIAVWVCSGAVAKCCLMLIAIKL